MTSEWRHDISSSPESALVPPSVFNRDSASDFELQIHFLYRYSNLNSPRRRIHPINRLEESATFIIHI